MVCFFTFFLIYLYLSNTYSCLAGTLTTGTDNVVGTTGNDTINASSSTFNSDDVINGGAGTDTMTVTAAGAGTVIANVSSVETIRVTNGSATASDTYALNMIGATGATELGSRLSSANVSFTNVQSPATVSAFGTTAGTVSATFLNTLASGTADSVTVKVDGAATATFDVKGTGTGTFETVNVQSAGTQKNTVAFAC